MPAWPGGSCPECGELMPAKLIHCQNCRALLNEDLEVDSVEVPQFVPLPEITPVMDVELRGFYVCCPNCNQELKIGRKFVNERVECKYCKGRFELSVPATDVELRAIYASCPHCDERIRANTKYLGQNVACKHCGGHIHILETIS